MQLIGYLSLHTTKTAQSENLEGMSVARIIVVEIFCDFEKYKLILEDKLEFSWEKE